MDKKRVLNILSGIFVIGIIAFIIIFLVSFKPLKKGDSVYFGIYEQDNDITNGNELIEWIVLDVSANEAVLLSKNILEVLPYSYDGNIIDGQAWELSYIRDYLNHDFYDKAFSESEKEMLYATVVKTLPNPLEQPGSFKEEKETEDKVYLLAFEELEEYGLAKNDFKGTDSIEERFEIYYWQEDLDYNKDRADRCCTATDYVVGKKNKTSEKVSDFGVNNSFDWYLRTKGLSPQLISAVNDTGKININGVDCLEELGVRPVIRVSLKNDYLIKRSKILKNEEHIFYDNSNPLKLMNIGTSEAIKNGSTVIFGHYEQDLDLSNGAEEIQWKVLDVSDDHILLLSKYILDYQKFNEGEKKVDWEQCSLRNWLNSTFLDGAFTDEEKSKMINNDGDYVFLLSSDDLQNNSFGFKGDDTYDVNRACAGTARYLSEYNAIIQMNDKEESFIWQDVIRSAPLLGLTREGEKSYEYWTGSKVGADSTVTVLGGGRLSCEKNDSYQGVRPAIFIKIR